MIKSKLPNVGTSIFTIMSKMANEAGAINLAQGFPNFDCDPKLVSLVHKYMKEGKNQYAPMAGHPKLLHVLAEKAKTLYGRTLNASNEITITAGATQALFTAISAFVCPGDEVVIIEPAYDSYRPAIELNGGTVKSYILKGPKFKIQWDELAQLITDRTKMLIINTPHNPTGSVFEEEDLDALTEIVKVHDLIILSDEVYEHIVFDGMEHQSMLRREELFKHALCCYSFGKTFHNTGWKVGHVIAPEHLMREFRKVHQFNVFSVNHPVQYALASYMEDSEAYNSLGPFYQKKRDVFIQAIEGSAFKLIKSSGSYFINLDYSAISNVSDMEFATILTKKYKLASIPISPFYKDAPDQQILRFCFAKTEDVLYEAGEILRQF